MRKVLAFHINYILEWHSYGEMESKIPTEVWVYQGVMGFFFRLISWINSLHTKVKAQNEIVEIQAQPKTITHGEISYQPPPRELPAWLIFIISEYPNITSIQESCTIELPEQMGTIFQIQV